MSYIIYVYICQAAWPNIPHQKWQSFSLKYLHSAKLKESFQQNDKLCGPVSDMQTAPPPPLKVNKKMFSSQYMRNVLKCVQKKITIFCNFFVQKNVNFKFLGLTRFLRNWFRNANRWYRIISYLRGFNPRAFRDWGPTPLEGMGGETSHELGFRGTKPPNRILFLNFGTIFFL